LFLPARPSPAGVGAVSLYRSSFESTPSGRLSLSAGHYAPKRHQGRLAAARRAEQAEQLAVGHLEVELAEQLGVAESLADLAQTGLRHGDLVLPRIGSTPDLASAPQRRVDAFSKERRTSDVSF